MEVKVSFRLKYLSNSVDIREMNYVKKKLKHFKIKFEEEFWKRPREYMLLFAVIFCITFKFRTDIQNFFSGPDFPSGTNNFHYRYYDYVEPSVK